VNASSSIFQMGRDDSARYVDCQLDEVSLFSRELTASEIARSYAAGLDGRSQLPNGVGDACE
jgi:hypothetical protein